MEQERGVVKWFDNEKNYGFITSDDGKEYFVHKSNVLGPIEKGTRVQFEIGEGKKGPVALNVSEFEKEEV